MSFSRGRMAALAVSLAVGSAGLAASGIPEYKTSSPEVCNAIRKNQRATGNAKIKRQSKKNKRKR